ncbi:hypothetical protein BD413DRAFT_491464 [Trametes elegans]|nr:hypothetical protein BD413DRAFT_491464 [Trametes elegans]
MTGLPFADISSFAGPPSDIELSDLFSSTQPSLQQSSPTPGGSRTTGSPVSQSGQQTSAASQSESSAAPSPPSASSSRKRVRPKIALAPDQPPTARGNDRIRVYVACHECRARKIRCDGAKPMCIQCQKRPPESGACSYDAAPNRKGHDRRGRGAGQGARGGKVTKKRRTAAFTSGEAEPSPFESAHESHSSSAEDEEEPVRPANPGSALPPADSDDNGWQEDLLNAQLDELLEYDPFDINNPELFQVPTSVTPTSQHSPSSHGGESDPDQTIPPRPSPQFARETWWDALVAFYVSERNHGIDPQAIVLTNDQRNGALRHMVSDLRAMFQSSASWLGFIHLPRFFENLLDPARRAEMQPSVLLSALALGTLTQSSDIEKGERGRQRALKLLDMAHGALQSSLVTGWVDVGLAQAACLILYFELNAHPAATWDRMQSAILLLDSLVRLFSLTSLDADCQRVGATSFPLTAPNNCYTNPSAATSGVYAGQPHAGTGLPPHPSGQTPYPPPNPHAFGTLHHTHNAVVINPVTLPSFIPATAINSASTTDGSPHGERACDCARFSLGRNWPSVRDFAPSWSTTLMWPLGMTEAEFRKEECRRLVWGCVAMIANLNAYASVTPNGIASTGRMFVKESENFALLTPSETLARLGTPIQADDVWTLSIRAMLLLHSCLRARASNTMSGAQRAEFAVRAWLEVDDLERQMKRHTCGMASNYGFQSTEMLFSLRLCVSYEFQRFIPQITTTGSLLFYRDKAEAWLRHVSEGVDIVWEGLRAGQLGHKDLDHRKSLFIYWYLAGIRKCLVLWETDPTLDLALSIACKAASHLEYLLLFWPSIRVRQIWQDMRYGLVQACIKAGMPPPSAAIPRTIPKNDSLPTASQLAGASS